MKRILVTGGAGFIGANLCRRLVAEGNNVTCLDNFFSGRMRNIQDLTENRNFQLIKQSVTEPVELEADQIYNLACPASPVWYQKDPIDTMKTCVLGALNMLELADRCGATILQTSTSEVYGEPMVHPQTEDYRGNVNPIGIRACYDEGKRAAETLFFDHHRQYGTDIRVVRIFNTYGPGMCEDDGRVISNFINQAIRGEDITIYGDGSQTRSLCFVSDLVEGLIRMMNTPGITGPVNLGNPVELSVKEIAERVLKITGSSSKVVFRPLPSDDPTRRQPDIRRAKELLGWQPAVPVEEGLKETVQYYKSILQESGRD